METKGVGSRAESWRPPPTGAWEGDQPTRQSIPTGPRSGKPAEKEGSVPAVCMLPWNADGAPSVGFAPEHLATWRRAVLKAQRWWVQERQRELETVRVGDSKFPYGGQQRRCVADGGRRGSGALWGSLLRWELQ